MSTQTTIRRVVAGEYEASDCMGREWTISRIDFGYGPEWLAACSDGKIALDPLPTLREAKQAVADAC